MSSNLVWEPVIESEGHALPTGLKWVLRKRFDDGAVNMQMNSNHISYLEGLVDGGVDGAKTLIDAIRKHGVIVVTEIW